MSCDQALDRENQLTPWSNDPATDRLRTAADIERRSRADVLNRDDQLALMHDDASGGLTDATDPRHDLA